eukprot:8560290-Karenia_brevis.AAC.2
MVMMMMSDDDDDGYGDRGVNGDVHDDDDDEKATCLWLCSGIPDLPVYLVVRPPLLMLFKPDH